MALVDIFFLSSHRSEMDDLKKMTGTPDFLVQEFGCFKRSGLFSVKTVFSQLS